MPSPRLFIVAALVFRPDPLLAKFADGTTGRIHFFYDGDPDTLSCVDFFPETHAHVDLVFSDSEAEAKEFLLRKVKVDYPESEGWIYQEEECRTVETSIEQLARLYHQSETHKLFARPTQEHGDDPVM